jgi:hypothetical protein
MPWFVQKNGEKFCVHEGSSDNPGKKLKCYDSQEEADDYKKALYANAEDADMQARFQFTELSSEIIRRVIDGMAAGTFTSMNGKEVTFPPEDLATYAKNTEAAILSTMGESGEIAGLPIDDNNHNHAGGAGWIVGVSLDKARSIIQFTVNWTKVGKQLIGDNIRRYFSPSIDMANKVILGGSLTNWPATRLSNGKMILRPIELSQNLLRFQVQSKESNMTKKNEQDTQQETVDLENGNTLNPELKELLQTPEAVEELGRMAEQRAAEMVEADKRKRDVVEFASKLVGGTTERPFGLPVRADEVVAVLLSLPPKQAKAVQKLLDKALSAAVNFAESGYEAELGYNARPKLSEPFAGFARKWVKQGKSIQEFFAANPELGDIEDYNVAEFVKSEEVQ